MKPCDDCGRKPTDYYREWEAILCNSCAGKRAKHQLTANAVEEQPPTADVVNECKAEENVHLKALDV